MEFSQKSIKKKINAFPLVFWEMKTMIIMQVLSSSLPRQEREGVFRQRGQGQIDIPCAVFLRLEDCAREGKDLFQGEPCAEHGLDGFYGVGRVLVAGGDDGVSYGALEEVERLPVLAGFDEADEHFGMLDFHAVDMDADLPPTDQVLTVGDVRIGAAEEKLEGNRPRVVRVLVDEQRGEIVPHGVGDVNDLRRSFRARRVRQVAGMEH